MFDAERAESPARFAKKHDYEAMQAHMAADANFTCAMYRFQALARMRKDWEQTGEMNEHFDQVFKEYQQYTLDAADYIRQYRERDAVLDQAIIDEDNQ
jgi:cellobiose phosphorylase